MKFLLVSSLFFFNLTAFAQSYLCDFGKTASEKTSEGKNDLILRGAKISVGVTKEFRISSTRKITVDLYKRNQFLDLRVLFFYDLNSPYASGQINALIPMTQDKFFIGTSYDMPAPDYYHSQNLFVSCEKK